MPARRVYHHTANLLNKIGYSSKCCNRTKTRLECGGTQRTHSAPRHTEYANSLWINVLLRGDPVKDSTHIKRVIHRGWAPPSKRDSEDSSRTKTAADPFHDLERAPLYSARRQNHDWMRARIVRAIAH